MTCRLATPDDLSALGDLRWRLQTDDKVDDVAKKVFVSDFIANDLHNGDLFHFVAERDGSIIGAMSVRKVWKVPAPGRPEAAWGYLTNSHVLPAARGKGVGSGLLRFVKLWAKDEELALLIVWPGDKAYPFYERAGFAREADPLVLHLDED